MITPSTLTRTKGKWNPMIMLTTGARPSLKVYTGHGWTANLSYTGIKPLLNFGFKGTF